MKTIVNYVLFILTDSYAGNFERGICYYVFGYKAEYYNDVDFEDAEIDISEEDKDWFDENTPYNGRHDYEKITLYEHDSNAVFFRWETQPPADFLDRVRKRIEKFPSIYCDKNWGADIKILEVKLYREVTNYEEML